MTYIIIGVGLFIVGLCYKILPVADFDSCAAKTVQEKLSEVGLLKWLEELWFLGRTTFTMIVLLLLTGLNWKLGLPALAVFGIVAVIEMTFKKAFNRPRPFSAEQDIKMLQPLQPTDPSFPSGDAMRIWFLVLILSGASGNPLLFGIIAGLLAGFVSLGRMVFGVHYLTDVLAGAGLAFLGAGWTFWAWQLFQIL